MNAQQRIERQLEEVLRLPGNDKCADCRASHPRWASVNLGIFLCVTCASVHRKMGTHTSRVKSVTLDEWTREQVTAMRKMGNIRSNEIYNPDTTRHPPPTVTDIDERDSELSKFIRRKYELGAFKAHAAKELATSNAVTSRGHALDARNGHQGQESRAPLRPEELPRRDRDLPSLPATAGRRSRPNNNAPLWSGLAPQGTGASNTSNTSAGSAGSLGGRPVFPPRTSSSPAFSASSGTSTAAALLRPQPQPQPQHQEQQKPAQPRADLLVDIGGSSSSTRPLQLNSFPTVPAFQPPSATPNAAAPVMSPGGMISPLALGQQAFFPSPPITSANPFTMGQQVSTPPQIGGGSYFQPMPHHQLATSPGVGMGMMPTGMGSMGMGGMGMGMNGMGMGASSSMVMGVGMPGAMGGGMSMGGMGVPVQVQGGSYQQHPWGSYGA